MDNMNGPFRATPSFTHCYPRPVGLGCKNRPFRPKTEEIGRSVFMNRADAYALLTEYVKDPGLVRHCLSVEAAMRFYARKRGADEEKWGIVGLLHDFDYERWPTPPDHPLRGAAIL